jgi:small GTP-binding protein
METEMNFLVLGDCGTGKTTLVNHFVNDHALSFTEATVMFDLRIKRIEDVNYGRLSFIVQDAAGNERTHDQKYAQQIYYKRKHAIIVVFDMTCRESFTNVERLWLPRIRAASHSFGEQWRLCLVANKLDLSEDRVVSVEEGKQLAHNNDMDYMELSSRHGNYEEMRQPFLHLAIQLIERKLVESKPQSVYNCLSNELPQTESTTGCCGK